MSSRKRPVPSGEMEGKLAKPKMFSIFEARPAFTWLPDDGVQGRPKTCLVGKYGQPDLKNSKVQAFDLDGCLIKPKSGNSRPGQADDWAFWHHSVLKKLQDSHAAGHQLVIFSNQNYDQDSKPAKSFKAKLKLIAPALNVPFYIFAGYEKDCHRKPFPGMWELFQQISGCEVDLSSSFFVGDAAGRKGDHSDTDRKFAINIGLPFYTPEEYFLGQEPKPYTLRGLDINTILNDPHRALIRPSNTPIVPPLPRKGQPLLKPEIVLFVGLPASGKTTFFQKYFAPRSEYIHVNQDTLGSWPKCVDLVSEMVQQGKSCVVDNTNRDKVTRARYIALAKKHDVACRVFVWENDAKLAWHNNLYRAFVKPVVDGQKTRAFIPLVAFTDFQQKFERPTMDEGFSEIREVQMMFQPETEEERKGYQMLLCVGGKKHEQWEK